MERATVVLLNKPWGVLCQFTDRAGRGTLADHVRVPGVYPAGRLDRDSEGLVVLTDSGALQARFSGGARRRGPRTAKHYRVQVEGRVPHAGVLRAPVALREGPARFLAAKVVDAGPPWPRDPPVDPRRHPETTWLEVVLDEGRNRQVRRMLAALGHPVLRLARMRVGPFRVAGLAPGESRVQVLNVPER